MPYGGAVPADETVVASGIAASIQQKKDGKKPEAGLPGDGKNSAWRIFFTQPNGTVQDRDIITDEFGIRYQVTAAYWNSLSYNCLCERLET